MKGLDTGVPTSYLPNRRMLRRHYPTTQFLQMVLCGLAVAVLLYYLAIQRNGVFDEYYRALLVITMLVGAMVYKMYGVFSRFMPGHRAAVHVMQAWLTTLGVIVLVGFLTKSSDYFSRQVVIYWAIGGGFAQIIVLLGTRLSVRLWRNGLQANTRSVLIGSGWLANHMINSVNKNAFLQEKVIGFVELNEDEATVEAHEDRQPEVSVDVPILGNIDNLDSLIPGHSVDRLYICLPIERSHEVRKLYEVLAGRQIDVLWVPDIFAFNLVNPSVRELAGIPIISISETPLASGMEAFCKKLLDFVGSLILSILFIPVAIVVSIAIKIGSPGPIFYHQKRHGWDGKEFTIWKFRSMYIEPPGGKSDAQATKNDSRVTPIGGFLRRSSIDELPQLINVLLGQMSLVGPRPHAVAHNVYYSDQIQSYMARHRIKPGLTGLAQVSGARGETETVDKMAERVQFDLEYINNWSVVLDIWILLRTPFALISNKEVY